MRLFRRRRDSFHDQSFLERWIVAPLGTLLHALARPLRRGSPMSRGSTGRGVLGIPAAIVRTLVVSPISFLVTVWASSRESIPFILGLPAVLTALLAVAPGMVFSNSRDQIRRVYDNLSSRAINDNNAKVAELYSQKLFALAPENREYFVRLASTMGDLRKDPTYALELIEQVAVAADTPSINAHLWIAQYFVRKPGELSDAEIAKAEFHLNQALSASPNHFPANKLAYDFYTRVNRPESAIQYIRLVAKSEPLASHLLLKLQKDLGRDAEFNQTLNNALLTISEVAYRNPDQTALWGELVACCMLGDRYQEAYDYVKTGLVLTSQQQVRRELSLLASTILLGWHDKVMSFTDKTQLQQAVVALNAALNFLVTNPEAIHRASTLYLDPNLDSKRIEWVMETLSNDENAYCTHLLIGWRALFIDKENGINAARVHWQIAQSSPAFGPMLAQLATGASAYEPAKVSFALQAIDLGLSIAPTSPELNEARAYVLLIGERWFEARQQLEEILPTTNRPVQILNRLIECCEKLDDQVKVEEYRAVLENLARPNGSF